MAGIIEPTRIYLDGKMQHRVRRCEIFVNRYNQAEFKVEYSRFDEQSSMVLKESIQRNGPFVLVFGEHADKVVEYLRILNGEADKEPDTVATAVHVDKEKETTNETKANDPKNAC